MAAVKTSVPLGRVEVRTLKFDLKAVVLAKRDAEVGNPNDGDIEVNDFNQCLTVSLGFGVLYAASLWDAYYRMLELMGLTKLLIVIDNMDILTRIAVFSAVLFQFVDYWLARSHPAVDLDRFGWAYWWVCVVAIALHALEHLAGRYSRSMTEEETIDDSLALVVFNRRRFTSAWSALVVTATYTFLAISASCVLLTHADALSNKRDSLALANFSIFLCAEVLYVFARLARFEDVAEQGFLAAKLAGLDTFYVLNVLAPMSIVFLVHSGGQSE